MTIEPRAVALGAFDGVHLGHRRVIDTAKAEGLPIRGSPSATRSSS